MTREIVDSAQVKIDGIRTQLEFVGQRLDAADRRGAHYAEVYGLVVLENQYREELARLEAPSGEVAGG